MRYFDLDIHSELLTAAALRIDVTPLTPATNVAQALDVFSEHPKLTALPVVADSRALGIVDRRAMVEQFADCGFIAARFGIHHGACAG